MNRLALLLSLATAAITLPAAAQQTDPSRLTVQRIYGSPEFFSQPFGPSRWLDDGSAYTTVEPSADGSGQDIVRYDVEKASRTVLVAASQLVPQGGEGPIEIEDYAWSPDGSKLLVFTNTQPVWRLNTRGDYWVLDRTAGGLRKLGGKDAKPSTLMFAKFSPDGRRVGYVRENNLYSEDLAGGAIVPLTNDGSRTLINGTFDWVYEEELMNYYADGWRWSPDGSSVAYWQLNADSVRNFSMVNNTDSLYSRVISVQYPKVGQTNSAARVGVVSATGGATRWMEIEGDPRNHYIARMEWAASSGEVILQRLNRLQNRDEVMLGDAKTGKVRTVLVEQDSTWVDLVDNLVWLEDGKSFTWVSERDGWKHVYVVSRDGKRTRLVTKGDFDVLEIKGIDPKGGWLYYTASPDNPVQRYLFRSRLDGKGKPERLSPAREGGTHTYDVSPSYKYAIETYSSFGNPPIIRLVRLPGHEPIRTLVDNGQLRSRVTALRRGSVEWLNIPTEDGLKMPGVLMKPADFDSTKKYPLLFFVYGGPGNIEVQDVWGGYFLWHTMLTQKGYLVAIVDNRGTPAPLGRRFRKAIYGQLGVIETQDQATAARTPDAALVRGSGAGRDLGLELRRVHDAQRALPTSGHLSHRCRRLAGDPLGAVRQRLHRAVQRADHRQPRRLRPRVAAQLREGIEGQPPPGARRRRRQRALPEHRAADQRAGGGEPAVRDDGVSEPHPLHLPGEGHPGPPLHPHHPVPRPESDGHAGRRRAAGAGSRRTVVPPHGDRRGWTLDWNVHPRRSFP